MTLDQESERMLDRQLDRKSGRRLRRRGALAAAALLAVVGAGACSDDGGPSAASQEEETVARIKVFAFAPNPLKVPAGTKVTWVNDDDIAHTATSGKRTYEPGDTGKVVSTEKDGRFDIALDSAGSRGSYTFDQAGTFHYFCDRHPGMEAEVVVS